MVRKNGRKYNGFLALCFFKSLLFLSTFQYENVSLKRAWSRRSRAREKICYQVGAVHLHLKRIALITNATTAVMVLWSLTFEKQRGMTYPFSTTLPKKRGVKR
jgi:hypothetical protein